MHFTATHIIADSIGQAKPRPKFIPSVKLRVFFWKKDKTGLRRAVKPSEVACKNYRRKLNEQQVREIKRLIVADFLTLKQIANQYNVGRSTISSIKSGRNWRHIGRT